MEGRLTFDYPPPTWNIQPPARDRPSVRRQPGFVDEGAVIEKVHYHGKGGRRRIVARKGLQHRLLQVLAGCALLPQRP